MPKPNVSIIMPTCKKLDYFKTALNSVLNQAYNDYEIIVTDDSPNEVIKNYVLSLNNHKIKYFHNNSPLYQSANHTAGMKQAQGKYIKILHDDDYFLTNDALAKMVLLLDNNPDCDFAHVNNIQINLVTNKILRKRHAQKYVDEARKEPLSLLVKNGIGAPSVTIFRNYNDTFFDSNLKKFIDTDFYISYLLKHPKIAFSKEYLVAIGECSEQDTHKVANDKNILIFEYVYLFKKYEKYLLVSSLRESVEKYISKEINKLKVDSKEIQTILNGQKIQDLMRVNI